MNQKEQDLMLELLKEWSTQAYIKERILKKIVVNIWKLLFINKIAFSEITGYKEKSNLEAKKTNKDVHKYSSEIYKNKLIKEFENALIENDLQYNRNLKLEELKLILGEMNLINPNSKNKKWEVLLKDMWKLLTLKKSCPDHISVRSAKIFVLGVWGISSQIVFETSEVESTPSTSTKESKISEEFVFLSSEQLNSIRSRFYEMVLHKLTYVKDLKSRSLKGIKEYKIESNQNLKKDFINPNSNIDSL